MNSEFPSSSVPRVLDEGLCAWSKPGKEEAGTEQPPTAPLVRGELAQKISSTLN